MEIVKSDIKKSVIMFLGFLVMSLGIVLIKESSLGLFPWGVFHEGLSNVLPLSLETKDARQLGHGTSVLCEFSHVLLVSYHFFKQR